MAKQDKAPAGGWLGPASTVGLAPLAIMNAKGKMILQTLTEKQKKKHAKFKKQMAKADKKGVWQWK